MLSPQELSEFLAELRNSLLSGKSLRDYQAIVDAPFGDKLRSVQIDLGIMVFLLVNNKTKTIDRIALSNTELAHGAVKVSTKPFHEIKVPVGYSDNIIARAISSNQLQKTDDWQYLFVPDLTAEEARFNQASAGIGSSIVTPFTANNLSGALIFSLFQPLDNINETHFKFATSYTAVVEEVLSASGGQ